MNNNETYCGRIYQVPRKISVRSLLPLPAVFIALIMTLSIPGTAHSQEYATPADLTQLPIEQLMNIEVSTASKFPQKTTEAPANVTIITANDIKRYGYRTLANILDSVRGMNVSNDRNYSYLTVRGSGRTGDYNSRVLLLIDGYRLNDPLYDTAAIGTEFPVDIDMIERVEVVRGPGSSIYGSNAVLGVINVITKQANDLHGLEASGELASFGTNKERLSYGKRYENGAELLLSGSKYHSAGQDLFFPEFNTPANNNGIAHNLDSDRYKNFLGKVAYEGFTLTTGYSNRDKAVPTASFGTVFNDPNFQVTDGSSFMDLGYYGELGRSWNITAHVFEGRYSYHGIYPYAGAPVVLNYDAAQGNWWGTEMKVIGRLENHKVVAGVEYQDNYRQDQTNFNIAPYALVLDDKRSSKRDGVYVQDEITVGKGLLLNAGLRNDHYTTAGSTVNPRLGLIWEPVDTTTLKLLYGTAFRAPNVYELYYVSAGTQKANPSLKPEKIATYEFIVEHSLQQNFRLTADVYRNMISDNITQVIDPTDGLLVYKNMGQVDARGVEFEAERLWDSGTRLRTSYAWQISRDEATQAELVNSPRHLVKLNYSVPVWKEGMRTGLELRYTSSRKTLAGGNAGGHLLTNLTLLSERLKENLDISASVYNLFDIRYADPGAQEHVQDLIMQDGRNYRLKLTYRF